MWFSSFHMHPLRTVYRYTKQLNKSSKFTEGGHYPRHNVRPLRRVSLFPTRLLDTPILQLLPELLNCVPASQIFRFSTVSMSATDKKSLQTDILDTIATREMAPIYEYVCPILGIPVDHSKLQGLKEQNAKKLGEFAAKLKDAEENLGETEVRKLN